MTRKLEDMLIVQYVSIASTIVYLYDLVLTFGEETELVWTTRSGRVGQYVFFFVRRLNNPSLRFTGGPESLLSHPWAFRRSPRIEPVQCTIV